MINKKVFFKEGGPSSSDLLTEMGFKKFESQKDGIVFSGIIVDKIQGPQLCKEIVGETQLVSFIPVTKYLVVPTGSELTGRVATVFHQSIISIER